jgi:short-subunit dehydrogenase
MMEVPPDDWRWIMDINVMGVVHGCRAALPHLQRNGSGLLINIASAAAFASVPGMIAYSASKAAVLSLSETLMGELHGSGMQVSVVMPSFFKTSLLESLRGPEHSRQIAHALMEQANYAAENVAHDVLTLAANGESHIVLPQSARTLWRLKRWMPKYFLRRVRRR